MMKEHCVNKGFRMIEWIEFSSKSIQGFPMGDPHKRSFPVYLPPGFGAMGHRKYPVVFFLAGYSGKGSGYLVDDSAFGLPLQDRFDRAIDAGTLRPFIGVFPDFTSKWGHSQYVNSPAFGNYENYLCDELTDYIDSKFPTFSSAESRIVAGHSSGGFGALIAGMHRPDRFQWVIASAADSFYEVCHLPGLNAALAEIHRAGSLEKFLEGVLSKPSARHFGSREFLATMTLAMAPCYAPNLERSPLFGDPFFDLETGAILPEIWEKYRQWDPIHRVDQYVDQLKRLKFIQLECGSQDEHGLQWGHRQLAKKFQKYGIAHSLREYPGGHSGHHWRFEERLTEIFKKFPSA
jgi:enterochelin esterase-like enzyme